MIPTWPEIRAALRGALRLAQRDPGGMDEFDLSFAGFWRSFFAAVLGAPAFALLAAATGGGRGPGGAVADGASYAVGWLAFPVAAAFLARYLDLGARYVPLVVAANWAAVVQMGFFLGAVLLRATLGDPGGALVMAGAVAGILVYQWYVVRTALGTTGVVAASFVLLDLAASYAVGEITDVMWT